MKELVLLINEQVEGPFPIEEIKARAASGELKEDTLCAEPGAEDWSKLSELVPDAFPGAKRPVRIAKKTHAEEEQMKSAAADKLDPEVRKKLMIYNLADAISVDKFSPAQADAAIRVYEEAQKKGKKLKIAAGVAGFIVSCTLASLLFNCVNVGTGPGGKGQKIFEKFFYTEPDDSSAKTLRTIMTEISRLNDFRKEVADVKFTAPRGQGSPQQIFLSYVEIKNPDASTVTGTIDFSAVEASLPPALFATGKPQVIQLKRVDVVETLSAKQRALLKLMTTPLWTDKELRDAVVADLASDYPMDSTIKESTEIWNLVRNLRIEQREAQLQWIAKRVAEIAKNKEIEARVQSRMQKKSKTAGKGAKTPGVPDKAKARAEASAAAVQWAQSKMPKFLEKLTDYLAEKEVCYSAEARNIVWAAFLEEDLPVMQEYVENNKILEAELLDGKSFSYPGRNMRNLIVVMHYDGPGDIYYVPKKDDGNDAPSDTVAINDLKVNRRTVTAEELLPSERYRVATKQKTGGTPCFAVGKLRGDEIYAVRTSPEWYYIEVEKVPDPESESASKNRGVWLGVPVDFFNSVNEGDEIPMEKLLTFERYSRPLESHVTGRLSPIPADKMETVKQAQEELGFAFPPPPEAPYVPEPAPEIPADEASAETDEAPADAAAPATNGNAPAESSVTAESSAVEAEAPADAPAAEGSAIEEEV